MTSTFKGTENHNITITTNTSQHVEFFHSLIFFSFTENAVDCLKRPKNNYIKSLLVVLGYPCQFGCGGGGKNCHNFSRFD